MDFSNLLIGLDVGTTSVKAVLLTADGVEIAHGRAPTVWHTTQDGVETDPYGLAAAATDAMADVLSSTPGASVVAVGVASMAEAGVLVAADDRPLAPVIAWHDRRDIRQLDDLAADLGAERFSLRTGLPPWTQWSLTKHRWLWENRPETRQAARRYNIAEWVVRQLGGEPASELSLASRTGWLDLQTATPWDESMEWSRAGRSVLGELVAAGTPLGRVHSEHPLRELRGATLTVAGHDHQAAVIGAGAFEDNDELDSCGTAEALLRTVAPKLPEDSISSLTSAGITVGWHAVRDKWCVLGATQGGLILQTIMTQLGKDRRDLAGLDADALSAPAGRASVALGLIPPAFEFSGSNEPADRWRAATKAVTEQARVLSDVISAATGPRGQLVVTGGWSNSSSLIAAKAEALGPLMRTEAREAGARGSALLAGLAHGTYNSYEQMPQPPRTSFTGAKSHQIS